jgi:hypothetical protein
MHCNRHSAEIALAVLLFGRRNRAPGKNRKRWKKLLADVAVWEKAGCPRDEGKEESL